MTSRRPPSTPRKPRGYWSDKEIVVQALQSFARDTEFPDRMPTAATLLAAGRADILRSVQRSGGFSKLASSSGLLPSRRRRGFWRDTGPHGGVAYVKSEIQKLEIDGKIQRGMLPSATVLHNLDRGDLVTAILCTGGFSKIANLLNLSSPPRGRPQAKLNRSASKTERPVKRIVRKKRNCWSSWRFLKGQVRSFAALHCDGHMPLQRELVDKGRSDLANAIQKHGGFAHVARRTGLTPALSVKFKRPKDYWSDLAVLHGELLTFMTKNGYHGVMPRRDQLLKAGRSDIVYAIRKYGGDSAVAADLHLVWHGPSSFWRVFRNLQRRLLAFLKVYGMQNMPSIEVLHDHGRTDLIHGIALHGGVMAVARRIGLEVTFPRRKEGYWEHPKNVQRELEELIMKRPLETQKYMPSTVALVQAGRADLATAVRDHGGWIYYGQRLGLRFAFDVKGQGFWQRDENVLKELTLYVEERYGTWEFPGKMEPESEFLARKRLKQTYIPCLEALKRDGRLDIAFALGRYHGGIEAFGEKYNLKIAGDAVSTKPTEILMKWSVFSAELDEWIAHHGVSGVMPMVQDFIRTGRNDLRYAMYKHGGIEVVAKRAHLVHLETSPKHWLPHWLGLQAGKLGVLLYIRQKRRKSKSDGRVQRKFMKHLELMTGPKRRSLMRQTKGFLQEGSPLGRRNRRGPRRHRAQSMLRQQRPEPVQKAYYKLTDLELQALRQRYKHLPPDDIIKI